MRRTKQQPRFRLATEATRKEKASKENSMRDKKRAQYCHENVNCFSTMTHFDSREAREKEREEKALKEKEEQMPEPEKSTDEESASAAEDKAKSEEDEAKAAVVLQSNYRGYKERKKFKERKKTMAGAELEIPNEEVQEDDKETSPGEKTANKQEENDEDEESTYEAEENDDSDHTQVPEDDEHTEVGDEAVIGDAVDGKEGTEEDTKKEEEKTAGDESVDLEEETKAATVLQSNFRGHKERKRLQEEGKIPAKKQIEKSTEEEEALGQEVCEEEAEKQESTEAEAEASTSDVKSDDPDETKAAVVLQSNFRGHKERKRLEEEGKIPKKRKKEPEDTQEPPKEEEDLKTEESVPECQEDVPTENLEGLDEEKAATVLQSNFRGHRDRKKLKAEREAQKKTEDECATADDPDEETKEEEEALEVTDVMIEHKDEAEAEKERLEEEQAAVKIQSNFRGYKDRKNLKANKQTAQAEAKQLEHFSKEVKAFNGFCCNLAVFVILVFNRPFWFYFPHSHYQLTKSSQDLLTLQQKLNDILLAHHSSPESNGMVVRGNAINGYAPQHHQSSKISESGPVKNRL